MTHTKKPRPKRRRQRVNPYIIENDRLEPLFWQLLDDRDPRLRIYVYRLRGGQKSKPALYIGRPSPRLIDWLQNKHGGGDFYIMIRRGKCMEISGIMGIAEPFALR